MRFRPATAAVAACVLALGAAQPLRVGAEPPKVPEPPAQAPPPLPGDIQPLRVSLGELRNGMRATTPLASLADSFVPFTDAEADAALRRGGHSRGHVQPYMVLPTTFAWRPQPDTLLWVISGRSGGRVLLAILRVNGSKIEHAASVTVEEADSSIAIEFTEQFPKQLSFSTCHGCAGEGGAIRLGDGGRVEITYR
jgi:hypothetical protein